MKYTWTIALMAACAVTVAPLAAQQANDNVAAVAAKGQAALARLEFKFQDDFGNAQSSSGQAFCLDAAKGIFVTRDVPDGVPFNQMKEFSLVVPGANGKSVKAELMSVDSETGIGFIKASDLKDFPWKDVQFVRKSDLQLGQKLVSVGLLPPQTGSVPYIAVGSVGAVLRVPVETVYVTGGEAACVSSPVFTSDGKLVGMVSGQMPIESRMLINGQWMTVGLAGRQQTQFFTPVEEFIHLIPADNANLGAPRRLAWSGILRMLPVTSETPNKDKLGDKIGVVVAQLAEKGPAETAGLKQNDIIIAVNDKPLEKMPSGDMSVMALQKSVLRMKEGEKAKFTVQRGDKTENVEVTMDKMPELAHETARYADVRLGFVARNMVMFDRYAGKDVVKVKGAIVDYVRESTPAQNGDLRRADIIIAVNGKAVTDAKELEAAMKDAGKKEKDPVTLLVSRGEQQVSVTLKP